MGGSYSKWKVRHGWLPLHPTCYIRKACFDQYGLYDESYKIAADSDLLVRFLYEANLKVEYLNEYIVRMRMGGGLSTDSARRKKCGTKISGCTEATDSLLPLQNWKKWHGKCHSSFRPN